ncbi:TorD/DmsD family molecular chaperone [Arcanobacterium phocae]|uniref:TorD/DmsD family molecular chaperone n=1 Tax=Arcanobacterium phocae TaxID=131112 RepID=UPI001C0F32D4|nr:molecular chaperone TorD family protein [Arcanobacterium phocae]
MLSTMELDSFAAAFTVLGRLHIQPANHNTRAHFFALLDEWPISVESSDHTVRGLQLIRSSQDLEEDDSAIINDQDMLYGISAAAKVAPYESVHRGEDRLVFDKQTLEVRSEYAKLQLQAPRYNAEPDDHIGLELDFIGQCLLGALDGDQTALLLAQVFTEEHIIQWAPNMLADAEASATTAWVRGICALARGTIESWTQVLEPHA